MLYKNEDAFSKAFKETGAAGLYLLFGDESYLIGQWAKKIVKAVVKGGSSFNFQKLDGAKCDVDALFDATEAMPFGAAEKCVLVDDLDPAKVSDLGKLEEVMSDLNPACVLVITCKPPLFDSKSAAAKKLVKLADKHGAAVELGSRGISGLVAFIKSAAKKNSCDIETDVCRYILDTCENDMHTLKNEVNKICAYSNGKVLKSHVDDVATPKIEARVFDLSKNILSGNTKRAFEVLSNLFYLRESPVGVLSVLEMAFVDMYRARTARDAGETAEHVARLFGYKSTYRVQTAFSSRLTARQLRYALKTLYECDVKMKSTGADDKILLEKAVAQLFALSGQYPSF